MKNLRLLFFVTCVSILIGCASSRVTSFYVVDAPKIQAHTFSFYERDEAKLSPEQVAIDSLIDQTITNELIKKGYIKAYPSDIYISFQITSGTTSDSRTDRPSYYGRRYYPYYQINITQYKEGVFLIEFSNEADKLLWQGSKTFKVRSNREIKDLLLQDAAEIIDSFKSNL